MMKNKGGLLLSLAVMIVFVAGQSFATQRRIPKKTSVVAAKTPTAYEKLLAKAQSDSGMFTVHRVSADLYFEIPDSLFGRDMLIVNKISGVPYELNDAGLNQGMISGENTVRFVKDTLRKSVYVTRFDPKVRVAEGDAIARSVAVNYRDVVIERFDIACYNADSSQVVIQVNKVFDGSEKSFNAVYDAVGLGSGVKKDLSKIVSAKAFPKNIVIKSSLSAMHTERGGSVPLTVDVTTNLVLLSEKPMKPRFADDRVGYFSHGYIRFSDVQQRVDQRRMIDRWRLEPLPADRARYLRGELVEPAEPIIFYIDPATPSIWVPYIKAGIEQWQSAFEQAGFKNAIVAREVDSLTMPDFDIDDVRYSVVTYAASQKANAMGPSVVDPRSGQILEADVIWWHNVMTLLQGWVRVQTGVVDPAARGNVLPESVLGNAIQFVSSHELGHSLGLMHNMGASYSVPVDSLRSKSYTDAHGTASSIMDYARFNYVAQPEDGVTELTPQIGKYDRHAIAWGYRWTPTDDPHADVTYFAELLSEVSDDPSCRYGEQSEEGIDPRSQSEDLGDDAVRASRYGLQNLRRMMPHILNWTTAEGEKPVEAGSLLTAIVAQWKLYADHVKTSIGGYYINPIVGGDTAKRYQPVEVQRQRASLQYLIDEVFTYPEWLFSDPIWDYCYAQRESPQGIIEYAPMNQLRALQYDVYYTLLDDARLLRMYESVARQGEGQSFTPEEMMCRLTDAVFTNYPGALTVPQRMSQKNLVDALIVSSNIVLVKTTKMGSSLHNHAGCRLMSDAPIVAEEIYEIPRPEALASGLNATRHYTFMPRTGETTSAKRAAMERILKIATARVNLGHEATRNHYADLVLRLKEALRKL